MARAKTGPLKRPIFPKAKCYSPDELSTALGKTRGYVRRLQLALALPIPKRPERYPEKYLTFMRRVVSLRTFTVTIEEIRELLEKEQKILQLIHFDSVAESPFWFMAENQAPVPSDRHLLLTGVELGFTISGGTIQCHLDFKERERELFGRREMGEDVGRVLKLYAALLRRIDERVQAERMVLQEALAWGGHGVAVRERPPLLP